MEASKKVGTIRSKSYRINAVIGILIMLCGWVIPPQGPITEVGMRVLGVFVGMIYLFSTCEVSWPSLLGILLLSLTGYCDLSKAAAASLGHTVVFQSIGAYIVAGTLNHYGVTEYIARWILSRKLLKGRPFLFTFIFLLCPWFIAIFTGSIAVIILFWAIFYGITDMVGYKKGDAFVSAVIVGVPLAQQLGGSIAPIRSWQLTLANLYADAVSPLALNKFMGVSIPLTLIAIFLYVVAMKTVLKCDFKKLKDFDVSTIGNATPMSTRQKIVLWVNAITFALVLFTPMLPNNGSALVKFLNNSLGSAGFFTLGAIALCLIWMKGGESVINFVEVTSKCIQWSVLLMIGATMAISSAIVDSELGFMAWITEVLTPVFDGKSGLFLIMFATIVMFILTNMASNIGVGTMMIPIVAPFVATTGANPQLLGTLMIMACCWAMLLPGASAPAALYHSNDEWLSKKDCYRFGGVSFVIMAIVLIVGAIIVNVLA